MKYSTIRANIITPFDLGAFSQNTKNHCGSVHLFKKAGRVIQRLFQKPPNKGVVLKPPFLATTLRLQRLNDCYVIINYRSICSYSLKHTRERTTQPFTLAPSPPTTAFFQTQCIVQFYKQLPSSTM